jgi:hypothetical protein
MKNTKGIILLDTFQPRQETIIHHIKPKYLPYVKILGVREADNPICYKKTNQQLLETYKEELIAFLKEYPQTTLLTNYYFGILPATWDFIRENQENIANTFVLTCQDDFYEEYAKPNNYPITPQHIITYSDNHGRWQDDLRDALHRPY